MDTILNRGDTAFAATAGIVELSVPCTVCFGKLRVTLEMGNGNKVSLPCDYCRKGYDGPTGSITEHEYRAEVKPFVVHEVRITDGPNGREVEYVAASGYVYHQQDVFASSELAQKRANERAAEYQEEEKVRRENCKRRNLKSYSWNAGYHMREVKDLRRRIEYHERAAVVCRQNAKASNTKEETP